MRPSFVLAAVGALGHTRAVLKDHGNMSSPTCLFVLEWFLASQAIGAGAAAALSALGPRSCAEHVLLRGVSA